LEARQATITGPALMTDDWRLTTHDHD